MGARNTGGTCDAFDCDKSRKATCQKTPGYYLSGKYCVCAEDECAVGGKCVKKTEVALAEEYSSEAPVVVSAPMVALMSVAAILSGVSAGLLMKRKTVSMADYVPLAA